MSLCRRVLLNSPRVWIIYRDPSKFDCFGGLFWRSQILPVNKADCFEGAKQSINEVSNSGYEEVSNSGYEYVELFWRSARGPE